MSERDQPSFSREPKFSLRYECQICGRKQDADERMPVFDFIRRKVHCGCADRNPA